MTKQSIQVYKSGTEITIKINKMPAIINSVEIDGGNIIYHVSYFSTDQFRTVNLYEYEFIIKKSAGKQSIGFK